MDCMQQIMEYCTTYDAFFDLFFSIATTLVAVVAIIVSIATARKQTCLDLWDRRWEIYSAYVQMADNMKTLCELPDVSYTHKLRIIGLMLYDPSVDIEYDLCEQLIEQREKTDNYSKLSGLCHKLLLLDEARYVKMKQLFEKTSLLFSVDVAKVVMKTWEIYADYLLNYSLLFELPEADGESFLLIQQNIDKNEMDKTIKKMEKFVMIKKC